MEPYADPPKKSPGKRKANARVSNKQLTLTARRALVVELRKKFMSYEDIAAKLVKQYGAKGEHGITEAYNKSMAFKDFKEALAELNRENSEVVEEQRDLDLERIDAILKPQFSKAVRGDGAAYDRVMEGLAMRAKWFGYNAPVRLEHSGNMKITTAEELNDEQLAAIAAGSGTGASSAS